MAIKIPLISLSGEKGRRWLLWTVPIPVEEVKGPFQLVILARRGTSYLSDIDLNYLELVFNNTLKCNRRMMSIANEVPDTMTQVR